MTPSAPCPSLPAPNLSAADLQLIYKACQQINQRYLGGHADVQRFIGSAWKGLEEARKKYDPARGLKFTTLAFRHMHGRVIDQLREEGTRSRVLKKLWDDYCDRVYGQMQPREAALEAVTEGRKPSTILAFKQLLQVEDPVYCSNWGAASQPTVEQAEWMADDKADTLQYAVRDELKKELADVMKLLPADDQHLVKAIYFEELTLSDVAQFHDCTISAVREHLEMALGRMRRLLYLRRNNIPTTQAAPPTARIGAIPSAPGRIRPVYLHRACHR